MNWKKVFVLLVICCIINTNMLSYSIADYHYTLSMERMLDDIVDFGAIGPETFLGMIDGQMYDRTSRKVYYMSTDNYLDYVDFEKWYYVDSSGNSSCKWTARAISFSNNDFPLSIDGVYIGMGYDVFVSDIINEIDFDCLKYFSSDNNRIELLIYDDNDDVIITMDFSFSDNKLHNVLITVYFSNDFVF